MSDETPLPVDDINEFEKAISAPEKVETPENAESVDDEQEQEVDPNVNDGADADDNAEEPTKKPKKTASERIKELNRLLGEERRTNRALQEGYEARLERLEKGLSAEKSDDNKKTERVAPDPDDLDKYPLGRLDDRYIEDKIAYSAALQVDKALGSALQRQQESDMHTEAERMATEAKTKIADISEKGTALFDDFVEVAIESALKAEYPLEEPTFHAVAEAEHGAQILYNLAADKVEAERVAKLTPYQQVKYVMDKNAEIAGDKKPVKLPKAGDPPKNLPRGANARYDVAGDTMDIEALAKQERALAARK